MRILTLRGDFEIYRGSSAIVDVDLFWGRLTIKPTGIIHNTENKLFALRLPNNTPQGPRKRAAVLMGARTPPRCRRAARRRSRGRGRHAVRARRVSRAAFGSSPFAPAVRDAVRAAIRARVAPPYTGLAGWRPLWRDAREFFGARGRRRAWTSYQVLLCAVRTDWAACGRKKWAALSSCGLRGLLAGLFARVTLLRWIGRDPPVSKPSSLPFRSPRKPAYG